MNYVELRCYIKKEMENKKIRGNYRKHLNHTVTCAACGKIFMSSRSTRKYCSKTCTNRYWYTKRGFYDVITPTPVDAINPMDIFEQMSGTITKRKEKKTPIQQQVKEQIYCYFLAPTKSDIVRAIENYLQTTITLKNGEKTLKNGNKLFLRETTKEERKKANTEYNIGFSNYKFIAIYSGMSEVQDIEYQTRTNNCYVFNSRWKRIK